MLAFRCDDARRRVTVVAQHALTWDEVKRFVDWQLLQGRWEYGVLYDVRGLTRGLSETEDRELIQYISAVAKKLPPRGPIAILTPNPHLHDRTREYDRMSAPTGFRVHPFTDEAAALQWLDEHTAPPSLDFVPSSDGA